MSKWRDLMEQEKARVEEPEKEEEYPPLESIETDLMQTLDDMQIAFRERANRERQRYAETCDSLYYFTVYFSNRAQMQEFCETFGLDWTQFFFDGREIAKMFRRALRTPDTTFAKTQPFNKDYVKRVKE